MDHAPDQLLRIVAPHQHFVAGVIIANDHVITAAPIANYMRGWSYERVVTYCARRGWSVEVVPRADRFS